MSLGTNDYAILGLLAARPWSAYELAKFMERSNLQLFWPRAVSRIYEIPKRLAVAGYATAREEAKGRRLRTVYRISPKGQRALRAWLRKPGGRWWFESEFALKVASAMEGSVDDLRATLREVREQALDVAERSMSVLPAFRTQGGALPERIHITALLSRLGAELYRVTGEWTDWAEREIATWSDTQLDEVKRSRALEVFDEVLRYAETGLERVRPSGVRTLEKRRRA